jgi:Fungal Zn(2)-Cys(6) binuclear cluster domain
MQPYLCPLELLVNSRKEFTDSEMTLSSGSLPPQMVTRSCLLCRKRRRKCDKTLPKCSECTEYVKKKIHNWLIMQNYGNTAVNIYSQSGLSGTVNTEFPRKSRPLRVVCNQAGCSAYVPCNRDTKERLVGSTLPKESDFYWPNPLISRSTFPFHRISCTF